MWQNVTAARALNTTYTNTTGKPIVVYVFFAVTNGSSGNIALNVSGIPMPSVDSTNGVPTRQSVAAIIPLGATYSVTQNSIVGNIFYWAGMR
jgi:hypothetical protein